MKFKIRKFVTKHPESFVRNPWKLYCPDGDVYFEKSFEDCVIRMNIKVNNAI